MEEEEDEIWVPCESEEEGAQKMDLVQIPGGKVYVRKAQLSDFKESIRNCKPTVHPQFTELYGKFLDKYGHVDQSEDAKTC